MPFLFKGKSQSSKGVLILKHSEYKVFRSMPEKIRRSVKVDYSIGVYFGFAMNLAESWGRETVDFVVATDNVAKGLSKDIPRIPLNGFNFIAPADEKFSDEALVKLYDFMFVGNSQTRKNLNKLVSSISELDSSGKHFSFFILNRVGLSLEEKLNARRIRKKIDSLSDEARANVTYMELNGSQDQLPKNLLFLAMRQSRALICPSRSEGAARIVAEAALRGLNIISYKHMKGGTNNFLDLKYDIIFDDFNRLSEAMVQYITDIEFYSKKEVKCREIYQENHSKVRFVEFLSSIISEPTNDLMKIASKLDMKNALSSHTNFLPSNCSSKMSDEALTSTSMLRYLEQVCEVNITAKMLFFAYFRDLLDTQVIRLRRAANLIKLFMH